MTTWWKAYLDHFADLDCDIGGGLEPFANDRH
jgi:hypothetical protein